MQFIRGRMTLGFLGALASCLLSAGCHGSRHHLQNAAIPPADSGIPRELDMAQLPTYRVAPPDILTIEAVNNIRPPETKLRAGDILMVRLANPEPLTPIDPMLNTTEAALLSELDAQSKFLNGEFRIQPDGALDLGPVYGKVRVAGMTLPQSQAAVLEHLQSYAGEEGKRSGIVAPQVSVTWPDIAGKQPITGEHLVRPDGTVSLGIYGSVPVAGLTLAEVKQTVETYLAEYVQEPEVNVDVLSYNSKVFYVIMDGGGAGERVQRLPVTGNETVLDAIAAVEGLSEVSSKRIWVARPAPAGTDAAQVMLVNWNDIAAQGVTDTNYQLLPGDRIYVQSDNLVAMDTTIGKILAPLQQIAGFTLLGTSVVRTTRNINSNSSGNGFF